MESINFVLPVLLCVEKSNQTFKYKYSLPKQSTQQDYPQWSSTWRAPTQIFGRIWALSKMEDQVDILLNSGCPRLCLDLSLGPEIMKRIRTMLEFNFF